MYRSSRLKFIRWALFFTPPDYTYQIYSLLLIGVLITSCSYYINTVRTIKKLVHVPLCKDSFRWAHYSVHSYKAYVYPNGNAHVFCAGSPFMSIGTD